MAYLPIMWIVFLLVYLLRTKSMNFFRREIKLHPVPLCSDHDLMRGEKNETL